MIGPLIIDLIVVLIALGALRSGWRNGGLFSVCMILGVLSGGAVGLWAAPAAMAHVTNASVRFLIAIAITVVSVSVGYSVGFLAGRMFRTSIRNRVVLWLDSAAGGAMHVFAALMMVWLVAVPLVSLPNSPVARSLRNSEAMGVVDSLVPDDASIIASRIGMFLNSSGLPSITDPFSEIPDTTVEAPADSVLTTAQLQALRPSIVQIVANAPLCGKAMEGSGWVIAENTIVTNAHVVAGAAQVNLSTTNGTAVGAVTFYDPDVDVAVIHVDNLGLPAVPLASTTLEQGDDASLMGFPLGGPFDVQNARIRGRITISGPNIYSSTRVSREVYTLRGLVREGNSGGPLFNAHGEVVGMIFGVSTDNPDVGFALTLNQVLATVGGVNTAAARTSGVSTEACVAA